MKERRKLIGTIVNCPRCKEINPIIRRYCKNCGYDFKSDLVKEKKEKLSFGLDDKTSTIDVNEIKKSYSQYITPVISKYKKAMNIVSAILGILLIALSFLPLFGKDNLFSTASKIAPFYLEVLHDGLEITGKTNAISLLINSLSSFSSPYLLSILVSSYELITAIFVIAISCIGIVLTIFSLLNYFSNNEYWFINKLVATSLLSILVLSFVFDCYGFSLFVISLLLIAYLFADYVLSIRSGEKRFSFKTLICKLICLGILCILLSLTGIGLVNLNVSLGSNLYMGTAYDLTKIPTITTCRGFLLQIMEIIQWVNTDIAESNGALIWCIISAISYIAYIVLLIYSFCILLYSFAKQNVKFPMNICLLSLICFYLFAFSILQYNGIINGISINMYIDSLGKDAYSLLSQVDKDKISLANSVFIFNDSMVIIALIYLPGVVGVRVCRQLMLRKTF